MNCFQGWLLHLYKRSKTVFCKRYIPDSLESKISWLVGRYMDKYARLMQIMQPVAPDVFKVCDALSSGLLYFCRFFIDIFLQFLDF